MSKQQNNIKAFFESSDNESMIYNEIELFNGYSIEYDFNNTDITANFSLTLDLDLIK